VRDVLACQLAELPRLLRMAAVPAQPRDESVDVGNGSVGARDLLVERRTGFLEAVGQKVGP
jgi:hypothetical protein